MLKDVNSGVDVSDEVVHDVMERFGNNARDALLARTTSGALGGAVQLKASPEEDGISRFQAVHAISYFYTHGHGLPAEGEAATEGKTGEALAGDAGVKSACCTVS